MGPDPTLTPELIQAQSFTSAFRGYDQAEVRAFLNRLAAEVRTLRERTSQLESSWRSAEERAARPPVLDEDTLMAAVGEETASILRSARSAAADLRTRAAADCEKLVAEAQDQADHIRADAEGVLSRETQIAEEASTRIVDKARSEAAEAVDKARVEADGIRHQAEQERALTIEGANSTRDRILEDLSRRRRVATVQIEQLRAGRERLIESYAVVRRTLEEVQRELSRADTEARAAADEVGRRLRDEQDPQLTESAAMQVEAMAGVGTVAGEAVAGGAEAGEWAGSAGEAGESAEGAGERDSAGSAGGASVTDQTAGPAGVATASATASAATSAAAQNPPVRAKRRGPFGRGRGSEAVAVSAEHPAVSEDPAPASGPHLRLVEGGEGEVQEEPAGSAVDELFAKIRAGQPVEDGEQSPEAAQAEPEEPASRPVTDDDEALMQKREAAVVDLEVALTRKLKRALQDEQNDLLDRLRGIRGEPTAERVLPDNDAQISRYASAAAPLIEDAAKAGMAFASETLGAASPEGEVPVADLATDAGRSIAEALRRRLEQAVHAHAGEDQNVLIESVGSAYREWKSQRIERISGDVLAAAFSRGTWHATPEGAPVRWVVEDVDGPCPDCDDDALAGQLPKGEAFPTGQVHPPAHSGCRCLLVPAAP